MNETEQRDNTHGEPEKKARFGPSHPDFSPSGNSSDPRGPDNIAAGKSSDPRSEDSIPEREAAGGIGSRGAVGGAESGFANQLGKGFTGAAGGAAGGMGTMGKLISLLARNKKKTTAGGVSGAVLGILLFLFGTASGPLEFVHLAQVLQLAHFSTNYDETNDRFSKLARYIYHQSKGEVYRTNLGYFQNKYADRVTKNMEKSGIKSEYNEKFGWQEKYVIDPHQLANTDLGHLNNASPEEVKAYFEKHYPKSEPTINSNGQIEIDTTKQGIFKNRLLVTKLLRVSGYNNVMAFLNGRVMAKRANFTLHPFQRLDRKALQKFDEAYTKWRGKRAKTIKNGSKSTISTKSSPKSDEDDTDEEKRESEKNANQAKGEADEILAESDSARDGVNQGKSGPLTSLNEKLSFKVGLGAASAAGVACLARGIDDDADSIKQTDVILPLIRIALDAISLGSQIMSGQDFDLGQLAFQKQLLDSVDEKGNKESWSQAATNQAVTGKKRGVQPDKTLQTINDHSPFHFLNQGVPDDILDPVCSTGGSIVLGVVSFLGGPVSATISTVVGAAMGPVVQQQLAKWLAGAAVDALASGPEYGNNAHFGARLAANSQAASNGARQLSDDEERQMGMIESANQRDDFKSKNLAYRLFNVYDSRSLASAFIDRSTLFIGQKGSGVLSNYLHTMASSFSSVFNLFGGHAFAASSGYTFPYPFPKVAFSVEEMNDPAVENPYKNADEVVTKILPKNDDYIDRAKKCFGVDIDSDTYNVTASTKDSPSFEDLESSDCGDDSENWRKVRFFIFDNQVATTASCYEGDDQACSDLGMGSTGSPSAPGTPAPSGSIDLGALDNPSDKIACAPGTKDVGVHDGYTGGKKIKIRVCAVSNITSTSEESNNAYGVSGANGKLVVNSRVSGVVYSMVEAAKKDGVTLSAASGFRTMAHQTSLCNDDAGCSSGDYSMVAKPGTSNHQLGVAVDFGSGGVLISEGSAMWNWLSKNANKFDYKPYTVEPWHWSPTGS